MIRVVAMHGSSLQIWLNTEDGRLLALIRHHASDELLGHESETADTLAASQVDTYVVGTLLETVGTCFDVAMLAGSIIRRNAGTSSTRRELAVAYGCDTIDPLPQVRRDG